MRECGADNYGKLFMRVSVVVLEVRVMIWRAAVDFMVKFPLFIIKRYGYRSYNKCVMSEKPVVD